MDPLLLRQLGNAAAYVVLGLLFLGIGRVEGKRYLWLWTAAFWLFALQAVNDAVQSAGLLPPTFGHLGVVFLGGAAALVLVGTYDFLRRPIPKALLVGIGLLPIWLVAAVLLGLSDFAASTPVLALGSVALAATGAAILRHAVEGVGRAVSSVTFFVFAVYALVYPILRQLTSFAGALEFELDLMLIFCAAVGVILMHFELARKEEREARATLAQAQRMESLGRLAGGVAHDFNNLLTAIVHGVYLALEEVAKGSEAEDLLLDVQEAATTAAGMTEQLVAFSRGQVLIPEAFDLGETVGESLRVLESVLGDGIETALERDPGPIIVHASPAAVRQVIMNLALNARDAMPEGGVIRARVSTSPPEAQAVLEIEDDGCGMDEETQRQIFEPFFTTKAPTQGTGLGLAAVYGILQQLKGSIDVESEPSKGSTFRVRLPLAQVAEAGRAES